MERHKYNEKAKLFYAIRNQDSGTLVKKEGKGGGRSLGDVSSGLEGGICCGRKQS